MQDGEDVEVLINLGLLLQQHSKDFNAAEDCFQRSSPLPSLLGLRNLSPHTPPLLSALVLHTVSVATRLVPSLLHRGCGCGQRGGVV